MTAEKFIKSEELRVGDVIVAPFGRKAKIVWFDEVARTSRSPYIYFKVEGMNKDRMEKGTDVRVEYEPDPQTLYLVCRQCGAVFLIIKDAADHKDVSCGSYQGFDITPEDEL